MGKGDARRPTASDVPDEAFQANWDKAFGIKKMAVPQVRRKPRPPVKKTPKPS